MSATTFDDCRPGTYSARVGVTYPYWNLARVRGFPYEEVLRVAELLDEVDPGAMPLSPMGIEQFGRELRRHARNVESTLDVHMIVEIAEAVFAERLRRARGGE